MKNLIREILKEEFEDLSWVEDVQTDERYLSRPKRYKGPTPMEKLLNKLGMSEYLNEPINGTYSYGLNRNVTDNEIEEMGGLGTHVVGMELTSILLNKDLIDGKNLIVWLGDLRPQERINVQKKLLRMGFKFERKFQYTTTPRKDIYYIVINPLNHNYLIVNAPIIEQEPPNYNYRRVNSKASAMRKLQRIIGRSIVKELASGKQYDTNDFLNKL